jgi:hypothetical protein
MEKSGMRLVRAFAAEWQVPVPGGQHGDVEYAITRDEWERLTILAFVAGDPSVSVGRRKDPQRGPRSIQKDSNEA